MKSPITKKSHFGKYIRNQHSLNLRTLYILLYFLKRKNSTESESPICTGNLLSGREYNYAKWARGSYDNRLESTTGSCRLLYYTTERIVSCLDSFRDHKHFDLPHQYLKNISKTQQNNLHFAFIGDSRIRQQFLNFVKVSRSKISYKKKLFNEEIWPFHFLIDFTS